MNNFIKLFIENGEYDEAYKVSDESLNLAIDCNNIRLIEQSYYLKGSILQKQGKYKEAEMYMNLSLDSLFKFGSKEERYNRYIDMANMYYHLGDIRDALKYFSLAFALEKNL
ncbi:Tetratricopeptide repeat protein [compost metagenome]